MHLPAAACPGSSCLSQAHKEHSSHGLVVFNMAWQSAGADIRQGQDLEIMAMQQDECLVA